MSDRNDLIEGLYELADFLKARPDVPVPSSLQVNVWLSGKEEFKEAVRALGSSTKRGEYGGTFAISKTFGPLVEFHLNISRKQVCRAVVKGTKWVEPKPEVRGHHEDVIEWVCDEPLLRPEEDASREGRS